MTDSTPATTCPHGNVITSDAQACFACMAGRVVPATAAGRLPAYYEAVAAANEAILHLGDFPEFNGFDFDALVGALREAGRRSQREAQP